MTTTRVPHQLTGVCDCPEHRRAASSTPRVLLVVIVLAVVAIALLLTTPSGAAQCAPPSYIDQHGHCFDPVAALAQWKLAHPKGIGPQRLGKTAEATATTGAPPCAGKFKLKQYKRANFFPAWNNLGGRVTECIYWPESGPPPYPYPPNNSYPDPNSVWGLHKGVPDPGGTGTMVTTNYLINCDAELFTGQCSQVFANTFDCQLQMTPQELSEYTEWAAAARYPATPSPCPASPFAVDGFESGGLWKEHT